ncbi:MAG: hypothetical protein J7K00_00360 [Candidatus Diapherotrites archaeon]|nr:hypothetical protein [Candidatus Diapherotrites archaeon]
MVSVNSEVDVEELAVFLVNAKINTYAGDGKEVPPQRPGFKELEFRQGDFEYRDSYAGFYFAPGQEVVRFKEKPVWLMAYNGGVKPEYVGDYDFCREMFDFLKQALRKVGKKRPFRGPEKFHAGDFEYVDESEGDVALFSGTERIFSKGKEVFRQYYIGGLIIDKCYQ